MSRTATALPIVSRLTANTHGFVCIRVSCAQKAAVNEGRPGGTMRWHNELCDKSAEYNVQMLQFRCCGLERMGFY